MEFFDNNSSLVQFAIVFFAFYVIWQIINKNSGQTEHMDDTSPPAALSTNLPTATPASNPSSSGDLTWSTTPPPTVSYATLPPTMSYTDAIATAPKSAFTDSVTTPATFGQVLPANIINSATPAPSTTPPANQGALDQVSADTTGTSNDIFTAQAADFDALFATKTILNPTELIPKTPDTELYAGIQPDPKLNQNFLQNRWSLGIDVSKPKRGYINDLRGQSAVPITVTSIWNNPTIFPDLYNKNLGEIS